MSIQQTIMQKYPVWFNIKFKIHSEEKDADEDDGDDEGG
tara:strand:- start:696 stop:812 length:117 start_codon:yes stop_codon:yes gene_type:complete